MEAMASGMPVVATRHSGIVELIDDGVNGLLVDEYDVQAMADRMLMLARDDEQAQRLGRNASRSIHEHPLVSNHLSILEGMIRDSIARN
jgi:colanic acid/amylovoran biosynthesis glycosyltransferase